MQFTTVVRVAAASVLVENSQLVSKRFEKSNISCVDASLNRRRYFMATINPITHISYIWVIPKTPLLN
jgi:hypothetical protein